MSGAHPPRDASSRFIWPPTIYGAAALSAWALERALPSPLALSATARWTGWALIALACAIAIAAEWRFWRAGTATLPISPTTAIVSTGVFAWTRNPIYLAMTLAMIGAGLAFSSVWFWVETPVAVALVTKLAIEREEAYLEAKFGETYLAYKRRVRRWL